MMNVKEFIREVIPALIAVALAFWFLSWTIKTVSQL